MIRVIATLLVDPARGVIKGRQFQHDRVIGEPIQWARVMAQLREVDEVVVFDVTHGPPDLGLIERIAAEVFVPLAYGGGIHDVDTAEKIVRLGVDKIVVQPSMYVPIVRAIADRAGEQAVVMCLNDGDSVGPYHNNYGEVLVQSRKRDGMMVGYDIDLILGTRQRNWQNKPIIASSGAGSPADCVAAVRAGADAVAAGAMYAFTETTPNDVKIALAREGYAVRMVGVKA